jgi:hypothetical protein
LNVERAEANRKLVSKRNELEGHESDKRRQRSHSSASYDYGAHQRCQREYNALSSTVNQLDAKLSSRHSSLQSALKKPPPIIQPLPEKRHNAMPIIFFLYMPPIFRLLSRFSFTAQQLLIPKPWSSVLGGREGSETSDITSTVTRSSSLYCQLSLKDHYNAYQHSQYHSPSRSRVGSDYHLLLRSVSDCIPKVIGSASVDSIRIKTDGTWYPDQLR